MKKSLECMLSVVALLAVVGAFAAGDARAAEESQPGGVVNINTASEAQLQMLPGIGPAKARAIVEYRAKTQFARPDDLVKVKGIGVKLMAKIKPYVVTEGQTTLKSTNKKGRARSR